MIERKSRLRNSKYNFIYIPTARVVANFPFGMKVSRSGAPLGSIRRGEENGGLLPIHSPKDDGPPPVPSFKMDVIHGHQGKMPEKRRFKSSDKEPLN